MNLIDAKTLLEKRRIPYHMTQYEGETEYFRHLTAFPRRDAGRKCKVTALVIPAVNGEKHIEMQFNRARGGYVFEELYFGGFSFELCDCEPDMLEAELMDIIGRIVDGKLAVIECCDPKCRRWISSGSFDLKDDDNVFGAPGFREAIARIEKPRTFRQKLTRQKRQYDIYDWRTCRRITK